MGAMLGPTGIEHVADPDGGVRRPQLEPRAKLVFRIALTNLEGRIRHDLGERPPEDLEQFRPEPLRQHAQRGQHDGFLPIMPFGLGASVDYLAREDHAARLQHIASDLAQHCHAFELQNVAGRWCC